MKKSESLIFSGARTWVVIAILMGWSFEARSETPSIHGMLLFGRGAIYASHLPMFHAPHDRQLVFRVEFSSSLEKEKYINRAIHNKNIVFTLLPGPFVLSDLAEGKIEEFRAVLYEGHFERGGKPLGTFQFRVGQILINQTLKGMTQPASQVEYRIFGEKNELFAVHIIQGAPSFDAIYEVERPYRLLQKHCRTVECEQGIKIPLLDKDLPVVITDSFDDSEHFVEPTPLPLDHTIGLNGLRRPILAPVKSLIYFEKDELGL